MTECVMKGCTSDGTVPLTINCDGLSGGTLVDVGDQKLAICAHHAEVVSGPPLRISIGRKESDAP